MEFAGGRRGEGGCGLTGVASARLGGAFGEEDGDDDDVEEEVRRRRVARSGASGASAARPDPHGAEG